MSDEHENQHHNHPFLALFQGPTEEDLKRQQMQLEEHAHDVRRFFDSLDSEQLRQLNRVIRTVAHNPESAAYYAGIVTSMNDQKFNVCLGCGKDHDEMLAHVGKEADEKPESDDKPSPKKVAELCYLYNVTLTGNGDQVECNGCKFRWISLQDRMLRKPGKEGCESCIEKEKWG